jgi:Xaa-Pro aminopeptidase
MIGKKTFVDVSEYLRDLRAVKHDWELRKIKKASVIAEKMLSEVKKKVKIGMTESQIWAILQKTAAENNCQTRFCIVQVDSRTSNIHNEHGKKKLNNVLLIDIGPYFEDYGTDITRTFFFKKPSKLQQNVYNIVLSAQKAALTKVKAGTNASEVDKAARDVITKAGYEKYFVHATGHGVGLEIHEAPHISEDSDDILKEGMVITIEPGVYIPNKFGVRIEDTVIVTKKGYKLLTHFNK